VLPQHSAPALIGRTSELEFLVRSFEALGRASPSVIRVMGPSGIGKSSTIRAFFDELRSRPEALLLHSRCHPRESVVFNAVDGFIDELSIEVAECLDEGQRTLPELQHSALAQVFPVLAKALGTELPVRVAYTEQRERRHLAFDGLCEILNRLSQRFKVVIWLDDVQWGDEDSGNLLRELLASADRPPFMMVLSYREEDERSSACLRVLQADAELWGSTEALPIRPLDDRQSGELVETLAGAAAGTSKRREELIRSAAGSPFLLAELARYFSMRAANQVPVDLDDDAVGFDDILRMRTRELPDECRAVLEVLAVAGSALEQSVTLAAAGIGSHARGLITSLERLSILRTTDMRTQRVEFYHDKLREEVMRQLGPAATERHRAIAHALLATPTPNPLSAIDHFEAAGDTDAVRRYVVAAANHALKLLAFERAARLYERSIELEPGDVALHELYRRLGSSLGSAGRGKQAALAYSKAADLLGARSDTRPEEVIQLKQHAAEQFIQTGHFQQGVAIIRSVLSDLDMPFPASRSHALRMATWLRLVSFVRSYRPKKRTSPPAEKDLRRFDALWAAGARLAMIDYSLSSYATARCAHDAVTLGEPSRMSRALAMEASFCSTLPQRIFQDRAQSLLRMAESHARDSEEPENASIFTIGARAIISFYSGKFRQTWELADLALERLQAHSPGRTWEYAPWQMWSFLGLALNGEVSDLVRRVRAAREEATLRDDRYVQQNVSLGAPTIAWLATDNVHEAAQWADRAIGWAPETYTAQHYQHYVTMVDYDLYREDALSAWERTVATWPSHTREFFLVLTFVRDELLRSRGKSALAAALTLREKGLRRTPSGFTETRLLSVAGKASEQMKKHGLDSATGFALLLDAGLAQSAGKSQEAARALTSAVAAFERADMRMYREAARYCLGHVLDSRVGRAQLEIAERWMGGQGVVEPQKLVATLAPGVFAKVSRRSWPLIARWVRRG
jgi:tetratricopeptide (TPR) repeat protein